MYDNKKNKPKRRINRKRQALKIAKRNNQNTRVWSVCLNTEKNLWRSFVVDCNNKKIICISTVEVGRNEAHKSLNEKLDKQFTT